MAMIKEQIEVVFNVAIQQARELESCADTMEGLARGSLSSVKTAISAAWQGREANAYLHKLELNEADILTTAKELRIIAEKIRASARYFRDAELRAMEIAKTANT